MTITLSTTFPVYVGLKTPYQEVLTRGELYGKLRYAIIAQKRSPGTGDVLGPVGTGSYHLSGKGGRILVKQLLSLLY